MRGYESRQGIAHGEHTEQLAASILQRAVEQKVHYQSIVLEKDAQSGRMQTVERGPPSAPLSDYRRFDLDPGTLSSQPIEASSQGVNAALSRHYGDAASMQTRTHEQSQALDALGFGDKVMFARIRGDTPGHVADEHVMQAMTAAKAGGIRDAAQIGTVMMLDDRLCVNGASGRTAAIDTNECPPALQASVAQNQYLNDAQALAQQRTQESAQEQDGVSGPTMKIGGITIARTSGNDDGGNSAGDGGGGGE